MGTEINAPGSGQKLSNVAFIAMMSSIEYSTKVWNPLNLKLDGLGQVTTASISTFEQRDRKSVV